VAHTSRLGLKGRIVIPAEVRRATGLTADSEVVIRAEGEGRVVIETADAARNRVWAAAPPSINPASCARFYRPQVPHISRSLTEENHRFPSRRSPRPAMPVTAPLLCITTHIYLLLHV